MEQKKGTLEQKKRNKASAMKQLEFKHGTKI
jgi:hypothetical protein